MNELLTTLIQVVVIPAIPVLVTYLVKYLKAKAEQTTTRIDNELVRVYLQEAVDAVLQAVTYTAQTYVDKLKKQGKWNEEAQKIAFIPAKNVALKTTDRGSQQMIKTCRRPPVWLDTRKEQTVKNRRCLPSPAAAPSKR